MSQAKQRSCCGPTCCAEEVRSDGVVAAQSEPIVEQVRERYGRIAEGAQSGCCGTASGSAVALGIGYTAGDLATAGDANLGLGCGAPIGHLALQPGESVLDLGSGPGLDAFLAARQVGPSGRVIGVDMTPAMLERARATAAKLGLKQVEFRQGRLEALPLEDGSVDAATSNCVINLVPDKGAVFREVARVLKPGGRIVVSDILLDGELPERLRADLLAYVGCVAGAARREAYFALVAAAGLTGVEILRDVDYLGMLVASAPEEVATLEARTGVAREEVLGKVRSVTFRASKPAR